MAITETDAAEMVRLYGEEKLRLKDIARRFSKSEYSVSGILRGAGVLVPGKRNKQPVEPYGPRVLVDEAALQKVIEEYRQGKSIRAIAKELGVGWTTVKTRLIEKGVEIRAFDYQPDDMYMHEEDEGKLKCERCDQWKSPEEFRKRRNGHPRKSCTPCQDVYLANDGRTEGRDAYRERRLHEQQGRCDICKEMLEPRKDGRALGELDHNHDTGRLRGVLCSGCNTRLAFFGDTFERVELYKKEKIKEIEEEIMPFIYYLVRHGEACCEKIS